MALLPHDRDVRILEFGSSGIARFSRLWRLILILTDHESVVLSLSGGRGRGYTRAHPHVEHRSLGAEIDFSSVLV